MRIVQLLTDARDHFKDWKKPQPYFGTAPEALLQGFQILPELEVHIVSCTQQPMHAPEKLSPNIWFHLLHVPKIGWLRTGYQGCVRAVRRKLKELQPDIVHGQGTERECALAAVLSGFPNVVTLHGIMNAMEKSVNTRVGSYLWLAARLERFTLPRALGVFCNSTYTESVIKERARRTWLVPNAVRREFFGTPMATRAASSKPILLNIGTISPHKRQLDVLNLAEQLHKEGSNFELHFIGAADPRNDYAAAFLDKIDIAQRAGYARYVGTKSLAELISTLDGALALIHAPSEESFGLVVVEALSRNLKVFAASVGGISDITAGVEGAELYRLDDTASLSSAIARWLSDGCKTPRSPAAEMRRRYYPEVVARQHAKIYREILSDAGLAMR